MLNRLYLLLAGLFLLVYILPLEQRLLFEPDETRYAEIPREMTDNSAWLEMRMLGLRYYEKPPLGYWLTAASISLLGYHPLAVRLPMALAAGGTALLLAGLLRSARRSTGHAPEKALGAAIIYLSCMEVFGVSTFAVLDAIFAFFVTLSMAAFFLATDAAAAPKHLAWLVLSGLGCAAAFLSKGFTALVIPMLGLALWLPWQRTIKKHLLSCLLALFAAALFTFPVALVIHAHNPDFWHYFFWVEHVQRFLYPHAGQHKEPFWYYLPALLGGALPWTFFLPWAWRRIQAGIRTRDSLTLFCLAWFVMPFLFFTLCNGKILTYILPCFAPLALLLAEAIFDDPEFGRYRPAATLCSVFFFLLALAAALLGLCFLNRTNWPTDLSQDPRAWWATIAAATAAAGFYISGRGFTASASRPVSVGKFALSCVLLYLASFYALPVAVSRNKTPAALLEKTLALTPAQSLILTDRKMLTAAAWHYRRSDMIFLFSQGELAYGLQKPEGQGRYIDDVPEAADFVRRRLAEGRPITLIMDRKSRHPRALIALLESQGLEPKASVTQETFTWRLYQP